MTYNRDIKAFAPFPSGALPTEAELRHLAYAKRLDRMRTVLGWLQNLRRS